MIIKDAKTIVSFMSGQEPDYKGRTYGDIIGCSDVVMEQCHDQVQWMFPLHEESAFASTYPVITAEVVEEIKQSDDAISNLRTAKDRMERFYAIGDYADTDKQRKWCKDRDHNLLRITRIIRCLRIFGLDTEAKDFYDKAMKASAKFLYPDNLTYKYWAKARHEEIWETLR